MTGNHDEYQRGYERAAQDPVEQEDTPCIDDEESTSSTPRKKSFLEHMDTVLAEPLSALTRILLLLALFLLLLTSVFIGLFAGAEYKLSHRRDRGGIRNPPVITTIISRQPPAVTTTEVRTTIRTSTTYIGTTATVTSTTAARTATETAIITTTASTTSTEIVTTTSIYTTTEHDTQTTIRTTTVIPAPVPVPTRHPGPDVCTTSNCVRLAASILDRLDETQDPCENFYEFANGGWLSRNEIPAGKGSYGTFESVSNENKRIIRKILDPVTDTITVADIYDAEILAKIRDLYGSCMDEKHLNDRDAEPLRDIVRNILDVYRSGNRVNKETDAEHVFFSPPTSSIVNRGLTAALAYMHSRGISGLFNFEIDGDVGVDPNFMTLWFYQPNLGLPSKEYYSEEPIVNLYEDTLARMLFELENEDYLGNSPSYDVNEKVKVWPHWPWPPWGRRDDDNNNSNKKLKEVQAMARRVVQFEKRIADASLDLEVLLQDPIATYNPARFRDLGEQLPQIDFATYFSTFTPRNFPERVILTSKTYARDLSRILYTTHSEVIEAYLVTRAALELAPYLGYDSEVWKAHRALVEALQGIKNGQVPERSDWCVQRVEDAMGFAVGRFFVQEAFGGDSRQKGTKVIQDIVKAFKRSLINIPWMDTSSAEAAAEKADNIRVKVGYPLSPNTESSHSIASYYQLVLVSRRMFLESMVNAEINEVFKKWQTLGKRRDPESWLMPPSMVNAYFNPPANEIVFPAGILQVPFFSNKSPLYLSYGAFGAVAAHELTHAFDSAGRLYDQHGRLRQWWTNSTSRRFQKIQHCIAEQYSNYTIDDGKGGKVHVNGNLTSGENIGDSGLIQAYRAWRHQYKDSLQEQDYLLPGLDYDRDQLFFISFGQIWAQLIKPAAALQRIRTDPHSPDKYRVEGTLTNIPEFALAFKCKPGSKLNPPDEDRCIFW